MKPGDKISPQEVLRHYGMGERQAGMFWLQLAEMGWGTLLIWDLHFETKSFSALVTFESLKVS